MHLDNFYNKNKKKLRLEGGEGIKRYRILTGVSKKHFDRTENSTENG